MLFFPRTRQRFGDRLFGRLTARIAELRQRDTVAFSRNNGADDRHAGLPGDIGNDLG